MLFISSPFRVSVVGGGTDYKSFFNKYGGRSIGFAINQGCLISVNNKPNNQYKYRLVYSEVEETNVMDEIKHKMLHTLIKSKNIQNIEIHYYATINKCNGLGTSSAFACSLTAYDLNNRKFAQEEYSIAKGAIELERELMKEHGGWQDQIFSAYGGICDISFAKNNFFVSQIKPNRDSIEKLNNNFLLIVNKRNSCKKNLKKAEIKLSKNIISLKSLNNLYDATSKALFEGDIESLKAILREVHALKQKYTDLHSPETEPIARLLDSLKCSYKVLGSGNGGGIFVIGDNELKQKISETLNQNDIHGTKIININIAFNGTKILQPFNENC